MKIRSRIYISLLSFLLIGAPIQATPTSLSTYSSNKVVLPILSLFRSALRKIIKAIDLRIQRLQNKTIWLQNAQKKLENTLSKLRLDEISDWTERQRDLYRDYYEELMKVKAIISYYQRIKEITTQQTVLVQQYEKAWRLFQSDPHFSVAELDYMHRVYEGILGASIANIDQIFMVLESFATEMTDAKRLEIINAAADQVEKNYKDLLLFNQQNRVLSLQRAKTQKEVYSTKELYGLP